MNSLAESTTCQRTIRVRGIVQGVGFRPAVWRFARQLGLCGQVRNDGDGLLIECRGPRPNVYQLIEQLHREAPAQARISSIDHWAGGEPITGDDFVIARSREQSRAGTGIAPDLATCTACAAEVKQAGSRRYRYAFTNCTHCGPRLSIIRNLPYDRANTSMTAFEQCPHCLEEYQNPADRRFHAQPNACPDCGPSLCLVDRDGGTIDGDDSLEAALRCLRQGQILALKGIGGFQLAVDAGNAAAVAELRRRKSRPHKPFALMARDLTVIQRYCHISPLQRQLLQSAAAPIVLLERRHGGPGLDAVAPDQRRLGFMLPTSPLHHLLLETFATPLVMTSGNAAGQPQCIDNQQALRELGEVADSFLLHDRDIVQRVDDSVVQITGEQPQLLRRARGYAPAPLPLPPGFETCTPILATGGDLKNTFCLLGAGRAILSQHIGDLRDAGTLADFEHCLKLFNGLYPSDRQQPAAVAVDQHPQYLSGDFGRSLAAEKKLPLIEVQHHHAHIAACMGDNQRPLQAPPLLAVVLDGMGFAKADPAQPLWGGEIFLADYTVAKRLARLKPTALPGGDTAMRQPWRNCLAQLHSALGWQSVAQRYAGLPLIDALKRQPLDTLLRMIDKGVNAPLSSSCGRLFDAVAAAVGIHSEGAISYEGQAAIALEACIEDADWRAAGVYPFALQRTDQLWQIDPAPLWPALLGDLAAGCRRGLIAARFHLGLAAVLVECLCLLAREHGVKTIALSGGVLQNPRLSNALQSQLQARDFEVLVHRQVPANDGGIALGQGLVAAAQLQSGYTGEQSCA
ncbi:carbamoyltransferase HypF [Exilibacterium tricleocarpae]|uniref:Carbamoyltransferase HypF n=1 Tax=Exilibacterium tricleocarpae TaxID=2591008 RepID=A0A545TFG8_9GAMM|nr:carbamoyltransferase HypF [Exilibacterium tricleocarpae]TQV75977.1 carbamoyltransferase HypF [Exilibacterium tricleocarpae]